MLARLLLRALAATILLGASAQAGPVVIKVGRGAAAEEALWLLKAKPALTGREDAAYALDLSYFPSADKRLQALEAGALDFTTANALTALSAASAGVPLKIVASLSRDGSAGASAIFVAKDDSKIFGIGDLKGKTVGVVGLRSASHFWALAALRGAGLNASEVTFVPIQFSIQGEAIRSGKIDVGALVEPFLTLEGKKGGLRRIFTSRDAVPFDEELIVLVARPQFLSEHPEAARAFLSDLRTATKYYLANRDEARKSLVEAKMVQLPLDLYLVTKDYERAPDLDVDVAVLKRMQDLQISVGIQDKPANVDSIVDLSYLPK